MQNFKFLNEEIFAGNELWRLLGLCGLMLVAFVAGKTLRYVLDGLHRRSGANGRLLASATFESVSRFITFLLLAIAVVLGVGLLNLTDKLGSFLNTTSAVLLWVAIGYALYRLVDVPHTWFEEKAKLTESKLDDMLVPIVSKSLRMTIILLVGVQIAQMLSNKPITSVLAGLGIGGLAVALAAQESIKSFFGSIMIFVDKPFEIGDIIQVDSFTGAVREVGLRSTKIETFDGARVTIPNGELASRIIQNIGKRPFIRRVVNLGLTYDTPPAKVDRALAIVKEILNNHEGMNADFPPRVYFDDMKTDSINLMVIYWYHPPDYWKYMEFTERFNKEILRRFDEEKIEFAYPTQTVYLASDPKRPLRIMKEGECGREKVEDRCNDK